MEVLRRYKAWCQLGQFFRSSIDDCKVLWSSVVKTLFYKGIYLAYFKNAQRQAANYNFSQ